MLVLGSAHVHCDGPLGIRAYHGLPVQGPVAPDLADATVARGNARRQLGRTSDALADYSAALRLFRRAGRSAGDVATVHLSIGAVLRESGQRLAAWVRFRRAERCYRSAGPTAAPGLARALCNAGCAALALGRSDESVRLLREAVEWYDRVAANNPFAWVDERARVLSNLGFALLAAPAVDRPAARSVTVTAFGACSGWNATRNSESSATKSMPSTNCLNWSSPPAS